MISTFDLIGASCVGRAAERRAFQTFADNSAIGIGLDVCVVHGLGGIGKTTLAYALVGDYLRNSECSVALVLDCVTLPRQPDMASLLRAVDSDVESNAPLRRAAAKLDQLAALVATAEPTDGSSDGALGSEPSAWPETKRFALELMTFFSSAAFETLVFGQIATGASSAVVAGVQTFTAARSSLSQVVNVLVQQNRLSTEDADIALDLETYVIGEISQYLRAIGDRGRVALVIDKAENLSDRLFRLVMLLDAAATLAEIKLSLIVAGRLVRLPAPDGSELVVSEFLKAIGRPSLGIELEPFSIPQVDELLTATHVRIHGRPPRAAPPPWLTEAVRTASGGLPLWAAFILEALLGTSAEPWTKGDAALRRLIGTRDELPATAARIFREVTLDSSTSAFPLLVALAIAPVRTPNQVLCSAAGVEQTAVAKLAARYSFMRGERLHDSARAVLRAYLAGAQGSSDEVAKIADALRDWLEEEAPEDSPHGAARAWDEYVPEFVELAFWADLDDGAAQAVDYVLTGLPTGRAWVGAVVERTAWFLEHQRHSDKSKALVAACVRAAFPILLSYILVDGFEEQQLTMLRRAAIGGAQKTAVFEAAHGRYLDDIDRLLDDHGVAVSSHARAGLDSARLFWLVKHGFDGAALALGQELSTRVVDLPSEATLRRHVARSLVMLTKTCVEAGSHEEGAERDRWLTTVDDLVVALIKVSPPDAAHGARIVSAKIGPRAATSRAVASLFEQRTGRTRSLEFSSNLGFALLEDGRFGDAETVFQEALARNPDWIRGAVGRGIALLGKGDLADAAAFLIGASPAVAARSGSLSETGIEAAEALTDITILALFAAHRENEISELVTIGGIAIGGYGRLLLLLFGDDDRAAVEGAERYLTTSREPIGLAPEASIALARTGRETEARAALRAWSAVPRPADVLARDRLLLRIAVRRGWLQDGSWPELRFLSSADD